MFSTTKFLGSCFLALSAALLLSCGKTNPMPAPQQCTTYYLSESKQTNSISKLYYNSNALLSSLETDVSTSTFIYDASNQLTDVVMTSGSAMTRTHFYFNANKQLISTTRFEGAGAMIDSMVYSYDSQGRMERLDQYKSPVFFLGYSQQYQYLDASTLQVDFYQTYTPNTSLAYIGSFKYTLDGKHKPYPDEYYYLWTSFTNVVLASNDVQLETFGGINNSTSKATYTYNSAGYPTSDSRGNTTYTYQCSPPTK